ncbi:MAG: hypothetical protein JOZ87_10750 [Chloroflexi bacterium]|nr:hypothetical protein [Chloroflexota bacterium]
MDLTAPEVPVLVEEILKSTDTLRGLTGREVTLVTEQPAAMTEGASMVFFTNCLVLGSHVVVREVGHTESLGDVPYQVAQLADELPLQQRVAAADLIVTGQVIASNPVPAEPELLPTSEHDPEWWVARASVKSVIKGQNAAPEIEVLFANSTDIAWYKSPKLREGDLRILTLRRLAVADAPPGVARSMYQVIDRLDALPVERLADVQHAHDRAIEGH